MKRRAGAAVLALGLVLSGCSKRIDVQSPHLTVTASDRISDVLKSDLPAAEKVQVIHDILDREQSKGQNWTSSWKETLAWLSTVATLAIRH